MELEAATYWLGWLRLVQLVAVFLVAIGVAAEFAGEWISRPLEKVIDQARELQLTQLTKDTVRLSAEGEAARAAIAGANERAAQANLALEKLKGPRRLNSIEKARIAEKLKAFSPLSINLLEFDGRTNSEVSDLGTDLQETIALLPNSKAHISIASSITPFASGIIVRAKQSLGDAIANALKDEGLSVIWPSDNVDLQQLLPERYTGDMAEHADAMLMIARKP